MACNPRDIEPPKAPEDRMPPHGEDPRLPPWHWMRLPDAYKGLGAVTASSDDHAHAFSVDILATPTVQWGKAHCLIRKDELSTNEVLYEEADYIIVRPTERVKQAVERAKEARKKRGSVAHFLKAQLVETRELWRDFWVATEGRREVRRRLAREGLLDHPRHADSRMKYYAWFRHEVTSDKKTMVVHYQEVKNPWEFIVPLEGGSRAAGHMLRKL